MSTHIPGEKMAVNGVCALRVRALDLCCVSDNVSESEERQASAVICRQNNNCLINSSAHSFSEGLIHPSVDGGDIICEPCRWDLSAANVMLCKSVGVI